MRRFITAILCLFFLNVSAQETKFQNFYKANKDKTAFSINLSSSFAGKFFDDEDDAEIKNLIKKSSDFKLMIFNNDDNDVARDFKKFSRKNNLKTLVRAKDKGGKAEILFLQKNDYIREIIIKASGDGDKFVLLGITTKLTKDELASIISSKNGDLAFN